MYNAPMVIFQFFKKQFLKTIHTLFGSFFLLSPTKNLNHGPKDVTNNHMGTQVVKLNEATN
jgi:hypothetical protein